MTLSDSLTVINALLTTAYVVLTFKILRANQASVEALQRQFEAARRPVVTVRASLPPSTHMVILAIQNTGSSAALNLRLSVDQDFYLMGNRAANLRSVPAFSQAITSLPPGGELLFPLCTAYQLDAAAPETGTLLFAVKAEYAFGSLSPVSEETTIDLRAYIASRVPTDSMVSAIEDIRDHLKEIRDDLRKMLQA
jgi:hypothetical protein